MNNKHQDIEQLLKEGKNIQIKPQGYSMYPFFVPGRDEAVIEPIRGGSVKRGDVVLYRRMDGYIPGILVLHRIWKCKADGIYLVGDNQTEIEGPLHEEQIKGIMVGIIRQGKFCSVHSFGYRLFSGVWLFLRPMRRRIAKTIAFFKKKLV